MRSTIFILGLICVIPAFAQSSFDAFKKKQNDMFNQFKAEKQAEYDAFRKQANEQFAEFMRQKWESFPIHAADIPVDEEEPLPQPAPQPQKEEQPIQKENVQPIPTPKPVIDTKPVPIAVQPRVIVVPKPQPAPAPIAPVKPQEEPYKKVAVAYFGTLVTVGFPLNDNLHIRALEENAIADAWTLLSDKRYDITVSTALNARSVNKLCDWGYMTMLREVTEKQYGKTNEAVLMQAFLMTQSGYRVRLGMDDTKLYMLVASLYDIFRYKYFQLDGTKFYIVSGDRDIRMHLLQITLAKYPQEQSLSLQMEQLPDLSNEPTPKRKLTSRKGVTASVSVNKNMIDFFNIYPQACFNGDHTTRWAAYANTPVEPSVKNMLYPSLRKTISGMNERDAVEILLNWVQTAFTYEYDSKVWGQDRAFFAQETLYYPYSDCEDRSILFSRLVRDLAGLDVVLLYYPGHLATAVAFNGDVKGDYLTYNGRKYVVCDPTYENASVGMTMPQMNNQTAQIIALK